MATTVSRCRRTRIAWRSGSGDKYSEGYLGVNYYFYGHRLKLQSGVEFGEMQDRANDGGAYSGTSWVTGLRLGW